MREKRMEKNQLFQIGEVSRLFHISISTLRHYDRTGLLRPEYTDPDTGYRYYSTRQFECLNTIRYLRALDIPLEQIAAFLQNRNTQGIRELLHRHLEEVRRRQEQLRIIERKLNNRLEQIDDALSSRLNAISLVRKPARRIASVRGKLSPKTYLDLEHSIRQLEEAETDTAIFLGKVGVGILKEHLLAGQFEAYDLAFLLLDPEDSFQGSTTLLPEETCLTIRFRGGHERAAGYYRRLLRYIREHGLTVCGFSKEITMIDYGFTDDVSQFVTEIQIPVEQG